MKIQIASDLHLENWQRDLPQPVYQFEPDRHRDLLILAGDITTGSRQWGMPFIRGNSASRRSFSCPATTSTTTRPSRTWTASGAPSPTRTRRVSLPER